MGSFACISIIISHDASPHSSVLWVLLWVLLLWVLLWVLLQSSWPIVAIIFPLPWLQ